MNERLSRRPLSITPRGIIGTIVVLVVAATCVRLGIWQLDRLHQRRERNAHLLERLSAEPVALVSVPADSTGWLYRRVSLHGRIDHERSIILPGRAYRGTPGAHVLAPLLLPDGHAVLVDRGWVPAADGATVELDALVPDSVIDATGLVLRFPGAEDEWRTGTAQATAASHGTTEFRRVWFALDENAMRAQFPYPLAPFQVQLLPQQGTPTYPVRMDAPPLDEGPHLGYALQWFSFAIIAIVGWIAMVLKSNVARGGNAGA
jgi:surfeit locus 1 family protein